MDIELLSDFFFTDLGYMVSGPILSQGNSTIAATWLKGTPGVVQSALSLDTSDDSNALKNEFDTSKHKFCS